VQEFYVYRSEQMSYRFLEHTEKEYWVNVYKDKEGMTLGAIHETEISAKEGAKKDYIKTISFKA